MSLIPHLTTHYDTTGITRQDNLENDQIKRMLEHTLEKFEEEVKEEVQKVERKRKTPKHTTESEAVTTEEPEAIPTSGTSETTEDVVSPEESTENVPSGDVDINAEASENTGESKADESEQQSNS